MGGSRGTFQVSSIQDGPMCLREGGKAAEKCLKTKGKHDAPQVILVASIRFFTLGALRLPTLGMQTFQQANLRMVEMG